MLRDILRENSWTYQETVQEGIEQGLEQGRLIARQSIETVVQARFPDLLATIQEQLAQQSDLAVLHTLLIQVGTAPTQEAFRVFLQTSD